jgi:hypothetical protein
MFLKYIQFFGSAHAQFSYEFSCEIPKHAQISIYGMIFLSGMKLICNNSGPYTQSKYPLEERRAKLSMIRSGQKSVTLLSPRSIKMIFVDFLAQNNELILLASGTSIFAK